MKQHVGLPIGGSTNSALTHLEGALSGRSYDADRLIGPDPADGKPLLARYDLPNAARTGIRVPSAIRDFLILDCLRESRGAAIAVRERDLTRMQVRLAEAGVGYLSLETAAAVAALPILLETRRIDPNDVVVVFDTGAGFKSEPPRDPVGPLRVPSDPNSWEGILSKLAKKGEPS
jgi:threonine synthase